MPELPEVEVVRRGLESFVVGRRIQAVEVYEPRSVRRHPTGLVDFAAVLADRQVTGARRRGKYLWLPLDDEDALVAHLGMSGQLLVQAAAAPPDRHLRVRMSLSDGNELRFCDQRTFGGLLVSAHGAVLPAEIAHIGRDPLDPDFDDEAFRLALRRRRTGVKRALLDQGLVSGIGNIYADEALWRARLHYARPTETLRRSEVALLLAAVRQVLREALGQGGTSFDSLYVDVNGRSGYFDRSLDVYGRGGEPCHRCGAPLRRDPFMNRSSYTCPRCQPRPRRGRW
ncbi:MAG TPA: bifunctional DNA-formamidopyrimidine glycosylase/DNA-(apurinic or apyrimidinic site) lyase [Nocardioidaceae bacterium]|nr:bifunctional DNA-formamidopyrimidine glycosylase/DNA-(apurinic or apyrimidinic site) lyase [Nocardioidaceae bacterium]